MPGRGANFFRAFRDAEFSIDSASILCPILPMVLLFATTASQQEKFIAWNPDRSNFGHLMPTNLSRVLLTSIFVLFILLYFFIPTPKLPVR